MRSEFIVRLLDDGTSDTTILKQLQLVVGAEWLSTRIRQEVTVETPRTEAAASNARTSECCRRGPAVQESALRYMCGAFGYLVINQRYGMWDTFMVNQ